MARAINHKQILLFIVFTSYLHTSISRGGITLISQRNTRAAVGVVNKGLSIAKNRPAREFSRVVFGHLLAARSGW
jgi:hypothetical protein